MARTEEQKARQRETMQRFYARRRKIVDAHKDVPCARCGHRFPSYCMDFHHRDPAQKSFNIGATILSHSLDAILDEIDKCDVLCAICHRIEQHSDNYEGN